MPTLYTLPAGFLLLLALAAPAAAEGIYAWRTDDGGYAYTDDPKSIPSRYREQAERREAAPLAGYQRFTPEDAPATARYAERLTARLEYLRSLNAEASPAAPVRRGGPQVLSLRAGSGENAPLVDLGGADPEGGPIVVDTVHIRDRGKATTRPGVVVRQDGRTLAVVKSRSREINVNQDILEEDDF